MIETEDVARFIAAFNRTDDEGFTPEIEQELMDTFPAIERLREENARLKHCGSCGKPLSRDCSQCQKDWAS